MINVHWSLNPLHERTFTEGAQGPGIASIMHINFIDLHSTCRPNKLSLDQSIFFHMSAVSSTWVGRTGYLIASFFFIALFLTIFHKDQIFILRN